MAKVIYDRSGKPHTIGGKNTTDEEKEPAAAKGHFNKNKDFDRSAGPRKIRGEVRGARADGNDRPARGSGPTIRPRGVEIGERPSSGHRPGSRPSGGGRPSGITVRPLEREGSSKKPERESKYPSRRTVKNEKKAAGGSANGGRFNKGGKGDGKYAKSTGGFKSKTESRESRTSKNGPARHRDQKNKGKPRGGFQRPQEGKARPKREPNPAWTALKAIVDKNKRGSAFLVFDDRSIEDAFVPRYYLDQLFHGDRVQVYISDAGEIEDLKVLEHRFKIIFGKVHLEDNREAKKSKSKARTGYLVYERKKAKEEVYLPSVPLEVKNGDWVKAELNFGENNVVTGSISEVIGETLPAKYDIEMVAGEFNLKEHHTFDAVKQAESYKLEVPGKDELGRTDLRHLPFITIDGERARDFDDAVYVEAIDHGGFRLWVAIADVSHYVKKGTPLDDEAYARATSVYFPERAFHMLPRALSEELCSLKPKVPRLAMACSIEFNKDGEKGEIKIYNTIIESRRRCTYNEIEAEKLNPEHATMFALYRILKRDRHARGSIDFDFPEAEIILDEKTGEPSDIVVRPRNDAHRLIEEFMIAANESVTEWMLAKKLPFIYRVHNEPSPEAITKFIKLAKTMGVNLLSPGGGVPRPKVLNEFITTLKGHAAEPVLATALLRSMRQAVYSADYGEHYGLASDGYTHFTSPIRRYPDLIVHRLLRAALLREEENLPQLAGDKLDEEQKQLAEMAEHCSYRERVATEAERESIRFKQIRLMAKHLGEEFDGKVNGVMEKGMFIQLWHPYCEGMVPVETMEDDWYAFDEARMALIGKKKKITFSVGTKVRIRVVKVDFDARRVEFQLIEALK
jgi:ribonuclease R